MKHLLAPLLLATALGAAEPAAVPATAAEARPAAAPVLRPSFGWTVPDGATFDAKEPGLPVLEVRPGSTAAALGIEPGDRILALNGKPVKTSDDVRAFLGQSSIGAAITVDFARAGANRSATGVMLDRPKPANLAQELANAKSELAALKALMADRAKEPSLAEVLQALQDLDRRLPKAVAAFKKQYPNGEFDIRIAITITSDKNAKDPIEITNAVPASATAATAAAAKPATAPAAR